MELVIDLYEYNVRLLYGFGLVCEYCFPRKSSRATKGNEFGQYVGVGQPDS